MIPDSVVERALSAYKHEWQYSQSGEPVRYLEALPQPPKESGV